MRSRVMPGSSPTMERREPVRRLKSVDLPTLGRPQMAMRGRRGSSAESAVEVERTLGGEEFGFAPGTGLGGGFGGELGSCRLQVASWRVEGAIFAGAGGDFGCDGCGGIRSRGSGWGCASSYRGGALGGESLALAGIDRSGGGRGARGAALFGAGGCLAMLLAEAFSVVALRH